MVPFRVDPSQPIYRQLVQTYASAIARGDLAVGVALPSVRALAERLGVNVNTVQKAYRELEGMGLAQARPGQGVFVHTDADSALAYRTAQVASLVRRFVADVRAYGVEADEAAQLVQRLSEEAEEDSHDADAASD